MKKVFLVLISVLLVTSCAHRTPFVSEYFYQALGEEGEIVLTGDMERIKNGELDEIVDESVKSNAIIKRATRISLSLLPSGEDDYIFSGAVEGNLSQFGTNSVFFFSSAFKKEKDAESNARWYTDSNMSLYSPHNGVLLFTDGDYVSFYKRSYTEREMLIDDETASLMAESAFALYVFEPKGLIDIGFEIPQTVTAEMKETCLLFSSQEGSITLSGYVNTTSEGTARALNTLLRNQIIQEKRREGESLDTSSLSSVFTINGSQLKISEYVLSGEMKNKARLLISEKLGGIL